MARAKPKVIQVGVVGAMQRAHPALTQLWLQWTGVPELYRATFEMGRTEEGPHPSTQVHLEARPGVQTTWTGFCDLLGVAENAPERRKMPVYLGAGSPTHAAFWGALRQRELAEVDGPLEWWWRLLVLRYRGVQRASKALIAASIGDEPLLSKGVLSFTNPSLKEEGRRAKQLLEKEEYRQPTHVVVALKTSRTSRFEGLAFSLSDASFRARLVSKMIDLAVSRT